MGLGVESDVADNVVVDLSDPRGDGDWLGEEAVEVIVWQVHRVAIKVSDSHRDLDQGLKVLAEARPDSHVSIIVDDGSTIASRAAHNKCPDRPNSWCPPLPARRQDSGRSTSTLPDDPDDSCRDTGNPEQGGDLSVDRERETKGQENEDHPKPDQEHAHAESIRLACKPAGKYPRMTPAICLGTPDMGHPATPECPVRDRPP